MLAKKKPHLDAWLKLPEGSLKVISKDPNGLAASRVRHKGIDYYSDIVEIDGESTVSLRAIDGHSKVFAICTTAAVNVLR